MDKKSAIVIGFVVLLFIISYFWRKYRDNDIKTNSKYTIGQIFVQKGSLNNGNQWYYKFTFQSKEHEGYISTHINYDVHLGDYFLINFSGKDPDHNKLLYDYKLNDDKLGYKNMVWDTIPINILHSARKVNDSALK